MHPCQECRNLFVHFINGKRGQNCTIDFDFDVFSVSVHFLYSRDCDVFPVSVHFPYLRDFDVFPVSIHFPYSRDFDVFHVSVQCTLSVFKGF